MAGAGYKLFNTGDVLTAAQVNTYLNEQTVMVFASSAARTSALSGVLAEGMVSYLQDTNAVEVYNGSAWTAVGGGGLTSPLTTKGDVWGYSTTNARIPVGANGTVLTADSAETLGVKWVAPAGGGKVLQMVTATLTSDVSSTSTSFADTGLQATITPSSASSKVLILIYSIGYKTGSNTQQSLQCKILRGATSILTTANFNYNNSTTQVRGNVNFVLPDSPNTTSATTYKLQFAAAEAVSGVGFEASIQNAHIVLLEIGA
jgi:hypothetical protein